MMGKPVPAICTEQFLHQAKVDDFNRSKAAVYTLLLSHRHVRRRRKRKNPLYLISLDIVRLIGEMVLRELRTFYMTALNHKIVHLVFEMPYEENEGWLGSSISSLFSSGFQRVDRCDNRIYFRASVKIRAGATPLEIEDELRQHFSLVDRNAHCCVCTARFSSDMDFELTTVADYWGYSRWRANKTARIILRLSGMPRIDDEDEDENGPYEEVNAISMAWGEGMLELPRPNKRRKNKMAPQ